MKNYAPTIILVRPQLPENIGLVARAMHNCGLKKLYLVSPREKWPNKIAIKSAANSSKIIKSAKIFDSLEKAVSKFNYTIATSARDRFLQKTQLNNFENLFKKVPSKNKIAVLFGPERSGLTNADLISCDAIFSIPLSNLNKSLNLSHSVLIFSYKWQEYFENFKFIKSNNKEIADKKSFNFFMKYLKSELLNSGFLYPKEKSNSMFKNIQSTFVRAQLSKSEIQTLWGMIKMIKKPKKRNIY